MFGFRDVEVLRAIAEAGGFRAAAARTGASQSAMSTRVAALERRLGTRLFDRVGRGVRLTPSGRHLLDEAERLVEARDRVARELAGDSALHGTVRLGVAETIVHTLLTPLLGRLHDAHPTARFELAVDTSAELARQLDDGALDVAILLDDAVPSHAAREALSPIPVGWYASAGAPRDPAPASLARLARESIVTYPRTTTPYRRLERLFQRAGAAPLLHGSASLSTVRHLIAGGFGIGILPCAMVRSPDTDGLAWPDGVRPLAVCDEARPESLRFVAAWYPGGGEGTGEIVAHAALEVDGTGDRSDAETRSFMRRTAIC